jgi:hypothetical protein
VTYWLKGNIASATSANDTLAATLDVSEFTVRGVNSGKTTTVSTTTDVAGNTLTVQGAALTATTGATPIAGSVVRGVQDFTFANITLDASAGGEDAKVTDLTVSDTTGAAALPGDLVNWELWGDPDTSDATDVSVRLDTTNTTAAATYSANTAGIDSTMAFTLKTPIRVSKNKSGTYQVKVDLIAAATTGATATHTLALASAANITSTGWTTGTAITETVAGAGQAQTVQTTGTLKVELAADRAVAGPIVAGSTGVSMMKYKLTAAYEDVDITELPLFLANGTTGAGTISNVAKVKVYKDGTQIGNLSGYEFNSDATKIVTLTTGVLRATKDVPVYIELKADFNAKEQATSGTQARVGIGDADGNASTWNAAGSYNITANGRDSGATVTATTITNTGAAGGTVNGGSAMGVFDGVLSVGIDANSPSGVHVAGTGKEVFRFWLTATGDEITVHDLALVVGGSASDAGTNGTATISAAATGSAFLYSADRGVTYATWVTGDTVDLTPLDPTAGALHVSTDTNTTNDAGWDTQIVVGAGQTKVVSLVGDTTGAGGTTSSKSLQYRIDTYTGVVASGIMWYDTELSTKGSANCGGAATYDNGADNVDDSTSTNTVRANEDRCVVDSSVYTKTLPINGNGLTYN